MRRRDFIALLAAGMALPQAAKAQQKSPSRVGFLRSTGATDSRQDLAALLKGLNSLGFVDNQDITIEARYAQNARERLLTLADELLKKNVSVLVANSIAAAKAKELTTIVPIVFVTGSDPVRDGLVSSLNPPGANLTGVVFITGALAAKRLGLLREILPAADTVGALVYPNTPETETERQELENAAKALGVSLVVFDVANDTEIESAFDNASRRSIRGVIIGSGPFTFSKRELIVASATRHGVALVGNSGEYVRAGGLISYGTNITEAYRQAGLYVGRILKGERPGELPVVQSSKFEMVVNLKAAKALNVTLPQNILVAADEIIE